jgi:hypothetical protein
MSKLRKWVVNWLTQETGAENRLSKASIAVPSPYDDSGHIHQKRAVNFTLHRAVGGCVVQARVYDRLKDTENTTLYVIEEDKEFTTEFAAIVSMEYLKV